MRTAVIGVGYLGRFHAQKYASLKNSELVGIADPAAAARDTVSAELGVTAYADYRELLGRVDAVSIVTPTPYHFAVAKAVGMRGSARFFPWIFDGADPVEREAVLGPT